MRGTNLVRLVITPFNLQLSCIVKKKNVFYYVTGGILPYFMYYILIRFVFVDSMCKNLHFHTAWNKFLVK